MPNLKVHFSSKKSDWETPQDLFDALNDELGPFDLDVCANWTNHKCPLYYGQHVPNGPLVDGLQQDWHKGWDYTGIEKCPANPKCWMNPPYGKEIKKWVKKAYEESLQGCFVVALLPSRTDTAWFHDYIYQVPGVETRFIKGRLRFGEAVNSAPFPSMIVIFNNALSIKKKLGDCFQNI